MINQEEVYGVTKFMIKYGGSFVKALGYALECADHINQQKIKDAFPVYWNQYKEMWDKQPKDDIVESQGGV